MDVLLPTDPMISGDLRLETSVIPRMPSIREDGPPCKVVPPSDVNVGLYMGDYGGGSKPIIINSNGMNIHLSAILGFTRCQGFHQ